jgi:cytochrome c biogenesis protein CcdA
MLLFFIAILGGVLTVLAPCILPMLPIIVGGSSVAGVNRKKAFIVVSSLAVSIFVFSLTLKASTLLISVDSIVWQIISGLIIATFGVILVFPKMWSRLTLVYAMNKRFNEMLGLGYGKDTWLGDVVIGAALGPIFSSCSPTYFLVLGTSLPTSTTLGVFYLLAYVFGLSFTLLLVAFLGQRIVDKLGWTVNPEGWFKRVLGAIFIFVGIVIAVGFERKAESMLVETGYLDRIVMFEQNLLSRFKSEI